jgi:calmodulin
MLGTNKPLSRRVFDKHDEDKSGTISHSELRSLCYDLGHYLNDEELAMAVAKLDENGDGSICYNEFLVWWREVDRFEKFSLNEQQRAALSACIQYFRYFDRDCSGALTSDEFIHLHADLIKNGYGAYLSDANADLAKLDSNGDGQVCFNEYVGWLVSIGAMQKN